jgi:phosphoribosylamine---glycine ligase
MNIAVIGSGGREHAITWALKNIKGENKDENRIYILPGNPGTASLGTNIQLTSGSNEEIVSLCKKYEIDLVVIGPEIPLVAGLADDFREASINVFGPDKRAAAIEGDKSFAKQLMKKYNIPTAAFQEFSSNQYSEAVSYLESQSFPIVIKANGLAAGKGVLICNSLNEALSSLDDFFINRIFGEAGDKIVVEEFMTGEEASLFALTDGVNYITLPAAQDHKRVGDNDTGKNTGGMGAYAPAPVITADLLEQIKEDILTPLLQAMEKEGAQFNGCLYCGLMITAMGPKVVEFNCRFGDPETQAVLPLLEGDFAKLLYSIALGDLASDIVRYNGKAAVTVVAASNGYPDTFEKGFQINGIQEAEGMGAVVFHSGTKSEGGALVTNGGRVLSVTAFSGNADIGNAKKLSYKALHSISFNNIYYRKDIADKALK